MQANDARNYFFQALKVNSIGLASLNSKTRNRFRTEERSGALHQEWDDFELLKIFWTNSFSTISHSFKQLTICLWDLQCYLLKQYRNDVIILDKLLNSIKGIPCCRIRTKKYYKVFAEFLLTFTPQLQRILRLNKLKSLLQITLIVADTTQTIAFTFVENHDLKKQTIVPKDALYVVNPAAGPWIALWKNGWRL